MLEKQQLQVLFGSSAKQVSHLLNPNSCAPFISVDAPEVFLSVGWSVFPGSEARTVLSMGFFILIKNHGIVGWVGLERICVRPVRKILGGGQSEEGQKRIPKTIGRITW